MTIYYCIDKKNNTLFFDAENKHHLLNVLKIHDKENIDCCYLGIIYHCVVSVFKNDIYATIVETTQENNENLFNLSLIIGLPKGDKLDDIIMHSVELGVNHIYLWNSTRSIKKIDKNDFVNKLSRYQKIILNACQQSRRNQIPEISLISIQDFDYTKFDSCLICYEDLKDEKISTELGNNIILVVGSEGGITKNEYEYFVKNNFKNFSLGKRILRVETAVYTALANINLIKNEL